MPNFEILFFKLPKHFSHFNELLGKRMPKLLVTYGIHDSILVCVENKVFQQLHSLDDINTCMENRNTLNGLEGCNVVFNWIHIFRKAKMYSIACEVSS